MAKLEKKPRARSSPPGFTLAEMVVALAIFAILTVIVAQSVVWSLRESARRAAHHAALETAVNVLEEARAMPFEQLDMTWAGGHMIPSEMAALLPEATIHVTLEADKLAAGTKRVTVEVRWHFEVGTPVQSVVLTTVLSRRELKTGGKP